MRRRTGKAARWNISTRRNGSQIHLEPPINASLAVVPPLVVGVSGNLVPLGSSLLRRVGEDSGDGLGPCGRADGRHLSGSSADGSAAAVDGDDDLLLHGHHLVRDLGFSGEFSEDGRCGRVRGGAGAGRHRGRVVVNVGNLIAGQRAIGGGPWFGGRSRGRLRRWVVSRRGGSALDGHIARDTSWTQKAVFVLEEIGNLKLALLLIVLALEVEDMAVLDLTALVGASINRLLKEVGIPAGNEVSVVAISRGIAVRDDEFSLHVLESIGVPDCFVEKRNETSLEALGAFTVHHLRRIGHVRPVVGRIQVFAIPARWEHDFKTDTVLAVRIHVRLLGKVVTVQRRFWRNVIVETVEANGFLL